MEQKPLTQQTAQSTGSIVPPVVLTKNQEPKAQTSQDESHTSMLSSTLMQNITDNEAQQEAKRKRDEYQLRFNNADCLNQVDKGILERYCEFCFNNGLSPELAQQAIDFYLAEQKLANREGADHCEAILRQLWQGNFQRRLNLARHAAHVMDKRLGGRLAALLAAGLGNNPVFAELMALVGESLSEDSLGLNNTGSDLFRPMSTEEFLRTEVFNNTNK
ncbi:hypothetical protein [Desulfovibrio litoralis]|uniref:Uncharacterized protein n=1 Tax=Desulfovibrio litoralis DSM 11393 TaxID=1121455 RepID=A0A1M7SX11_9BACT|nr:hypothetical protein [Desulfovibrio litoralis]SHN62918.1 hypothetical protein SAMN02745728_01316 [Desulfovibrio litoralis DSM 11393]